MINYLMSKPQVLPLKKNGDCSKYIFGWGQIWPLIKAFNTVVAIYCMITIVISPQFLMVFKETNFKNVNISQHWMTINNNRRNSLSFDREWMMLHDGCLFYCYQTKCGLLYTYWIPGPRLGYLGSSSHAWVTQESLSQVRGSLVRGSIGLVISRT